MGGQTASEKKGPHLITMFMFGDLMTRRGTGQIWSFPGNAILHEPYLKDAGRYLKIDEQTNEPIRRRVDLAYILGFAAINSSTGNIAFREMTPTRAEKQLHAPLEMGSLNDTDL
jgi:hypothetical protein